MLFHMDTFPRSVKRKVEGGLVRFAITYDSTVVGFRF